jgi:hypothetical protein
VRAPRRRVNLSEVSKLAEVATPLRWTGHRPKTIWRWRFTCWRSMAACGGESQATSVRATAGAFLLATGAASSTRIVYERKSEARRSTLGACGSIGRRA